LSDVRRQLSVNVYELINL